MAALRLLSDLKESKAMKPKRAAIYARVSTDTQTTENQLRELRAVAERAGWQVVEEFIDHAISGAKGREQRPAFDRMLRAVARRQVDVVAAWSVDRLGRSLQHLVGFLDEIHSKRVDLYLHQQGLDTSTPSGRALFQMCGVFSEFERSMIQERVRAGLARARASGKALGRPRVSNEIEEQIVALRTEGLGMLKIARRLKVGSGTVQRVLRAPVAPILASVASAAA
jgi:DNA invertase Pin-like site-specific DNA recombinase